MLGCAIVLQLEMDNTELRTRVCNELIQLVEETNNDHVRYVLSSYASAVEVPSRGPHARRFLGYKQAMKCGQSSDI
ncbi:hypothetical protein Leryth_026908 [Lithospermum erythrorhizon]|nr:hypothetical protein Leryth_026908 [Lithospermum erythrorhizon]